MIAVDSNGTRMQDDGRNSARNISQHFRKEEKSTGKLLEDGIEYISSYEEAYGDYSFTSDLLFKHLHNLFGGEAKQFYIKNVPFKIGHKKK